MVQQPFVGPAVGQQQPQAAGGSANTTLALPAIITNQQQPQQSQYSPQANYYQQQLIKSAQQQFGQQQQPRLNGIQQQPTQSVGQHQQDSPASQHIQQAAHEGLYNNGRSVAPIYAPKPSFYGQTPQQQQTQPQSMYQPTATRPIQQAYYQQQQQHSPASLALQATNGQSVGQAVGLSVRQLPPMQANGIMAQAAASPPKGPGLSPMQAAEQQQRQQQQQMQQLIISYQQQQQLSDIMLQPGTQQPAYLHAAMNQSVQEQLVQQHVDVRWSQLEEQRHFQQQQQQQLSHHHHQHPQIVARAPSDRLGRNAAHRFSDRDSISTLSRFNQLDDRRSFTMRSQYTNANNLNRNTRQFSFVKLTGEALKRIMGFGGFNSRPLLPPDHINPKRNLHRNLGLSVTGTNGNINKNSTQQPFGSTSQHNNTHQANAADAKVTVIDSGEDYYFKRKVFKYQLVILRLISLMGALFVLLSPVAMLIIPKMESLFGSGHNAYGDSQALSSSNQFDATNGQTSPVPSITHAVGLSGLNKQAHHFAPPPQWRISECNSDCDGPLIGFVARFIMLCVAYWAIFFRAQTATLPRIDFHRCLLTSTAILLTIAYWLFFVFRVFDKRFNDFELSYMTIVQFSLSMLESLILLHYLAVVLLELRQKKKAFCLKVVRSPDGASQYYSCGTLSIQKCAQFILEKYHRDFKHYGPYSEHLLELEDQSAQNSIKPEQDGQDGEKTRSRPISPVNSIRGGGDTRGGRASRRSTSMASRHHSRAGSNTAHHRSPSRSPVRSTRSRSQRKSHETERGNSRSNQVKLYQVDLNPPSVHNSSSNGNGNTSNNNEELQAALSDKNTPGSSSSKNFQESSIPAAESKQHENDSNSADQSSDAASRMKESSLETIRAANSTSDLLNQQQAKTPASSSKQTSSKINRGSEDQQLRSTSRDETESIRSVRSRRSTTRSHHRHRDHHHHRERSSSRANERDFDASDDHRHSHSVSVSIPTSGADLIEDHERKLRRRKFRLLVAVQDAFEQVRRFDEVDDQNNQQQQADSSTSLSQAPQQPKQALGPNQAARSLYPSMARSLQKYLRLTKQTGRHNLQSIYEHLSKCLLHGLSARTFLEKFTNQDPVWQQSETNLFANCRLSDSMVMYPHKRAAELEINSWSLVCDTLLSRQIDSDTFFVLKQGQVSLLVSVARLPHLNLTEEVINHKSCEILLGPKSESAV